MSEFLAEARVVIVPDTTKFRALLEAELAVATRKPIVIPVLAGVGGTTAASDAAGAAVQKQAIATNELARTQDRAAISAQKLALAQAAVEGAASAVGAAQITFTRSVAAVTAAEAELAAALRTGNFFLAEAATRSLRLAEVQHLEALSALEAARAQQLHAASLGGVSKGAGSAGLALLGVRGATLAASAPFLAGAAAAVIFTKSIQSAARLQKDLNVFRVVAGATADEMARVSEQAQKLGRDVRLPAVAAGDAAAAMTELAKAGLSVEASIAGAEGVLQLATAAEIDNAKASELVANALNAFNLEGADAVKVADLLTGAANESQGSIEDMGIGLRQVAGAATLLGLTVEDTVALLTQLTQAGLAGSDAGTTLRVALVRLANPDTRKEVEKLVGSLQDVNGNLDPVKLVQFGEEITRSGGKIDQTNKLYKLFGENSLRVIGLLAQKGVPGFQAISKEITKSGLAAEVSGARTEGFSGQVEALSSNMETLGTTIGTAVLPVVGNLVFGLSALVGGTNSAIAAVKGLIAPPFQAAKSVEELTVQLNEATAKAATYAVLFDGVIPPNLQERIDGLSKAISPKLADTLTDAAERANHLKGILEGLGDAAAAAVAKVVPVTLDTKLAVAEATGSDEDVLRVLRAKEANQEAFLERQMALPQTKARQQTVQKAAAQLEQTRGQIQSILDKNASAAKTAADDAARALDEADSALRDSLGLRESKLNNAVIAAQATARLDDDIKAQTALRNFYKRAIAEVAKTVHDATLAAQIIATLTADLINANSAITDAKKAQIDAVKAERAAERDRVRESLALDVQIAEASGNTGREAAARQAEIDNLKRIRAMYRRGTNQYKQLTLEIIQKTKALEELGKAKGEEGRTFQQASFEFLQQQQGFAANLLGNLIPSGATAGLVGGASQAGVSAIRTPGVGVAQESQIAAGKDVGFSAGQGNTTNELLRQIRDALKVLNGSQQAPEAHTQRVMQSGSAEYQAM